MDLIQDSTSRTNEFHLLLTVLIKALYESRHEKTGFFAFAKTDFCLCKNKGADQLCSYCTADQHLCFRYMDSTTPPLLKSEIQSFQPASVTAQANFCRTWLETPKTGAKIVLWLIYVLTSLNCLLFEVCYHTISILSVPRIKQMNN